MALCILAAAALLPLCSVQVAPTERKTSLTGQVIKVESFASTILGNQRPIWVYLPPDYDRETKRRYPVLYMHDGQNVFDGMTSYIPNMEWRADEAAESLIRAGLIEPLIIVGVANAGMDRGNEYLPTRAKLGQNEVGGNADKYGKFLTEEVMPYINKTYRTKTSAADTGLCGSSFGGVITMHLGLTRSDKFGKLGVVSPSVWWDNRILVKSVEALKKKLPLKVWLDIGTDEGGPGPVLDAGSLKNALVEKGWIEGKDLAYFVDPGAKHNEAAWAGRIDAILLFLYRAR